MRVAILANDADSYVLPMAQGLERMLRRLGVESTVFYQGLNMLQPSSTSALKSVAKKTLASGFFARLRRFDVIIVVSGMPLAFLDSLRVETLRGFTPRIPIVLYANYYLPTRPWMISWLANGNPEAGIREGNQHGLQRYDWYLCTSVASRCPMPQGPQPYSLIGLNLDDGSLGVRRKDEFVALVDFERPGYLKERSVQIQALEETNTKYLVLQGHYTIPEIRKIYLMSSIYFLASSESFGLPICELQACGAYVFTPYAVWCQSHWIKPDLGVGGPGILSPNFMVYDNDKDRLISEIEHVKAAYDPREVVEHFHRYHPQLYFGDSGELQRFVNMIRDGEINSRSHQAYPDIETLMVLAAACP